MCNTFQQLSSLSHVEISTSWDQMSSSDLITANQLKKLQLNSQQSWNSPSTQGPQRALEESQCFQKRSRRQSRLPLPYATAFTYESWICQERLESIPKLFTYFFPTQELPQATEIQAGRQTTQHWSVRVTQLSPFFKFQWKQLCFKNNYKPSNVTRLVAKYKKQTPIVRASPDSLKHVWFLNFPSINWNVIREKVCILTWYKTDFTLAMSIFMQSFASENVIIFFYVNNTQNKAFQAHTGKQYLWRVLPFSFP